MSATESTSVASKVLALLGAFDAAHRELTLTELARRAGLTLSTAQRRAAELTAWGALERTDAGGTASACGCGRWARSHPVGYLYTPDLEEPPNPPSRPSSIGRYLRIRV